MDKSEQSPLRMTYKEECKNETLQSPQNQSSLSKQSKEYPKYSSFLYGEQFGKSDLNSKDQLHLKRRSTDSFDDNIDNGHYYKKSKPSVSPDSAEEGSTSTCSDEDRSFSSRTTPNHKQLSPQITPNTSMNRDPSLTSQYSHYPNVPYLKSMDSEKRPDFNHYPLSSHHLRGESFAKDFFNSIKPPGLFPYLNDEADDRNDGLGSELLIAAYNNFVRKVVDETLDRTITFCEQPRNAISALERICSKAWPQLEAKRHRNRIRAYLKACRRNSKKNRGQINMKEPPMNALSAEARQMVATAMTLVRKDIEQLREDLKRDNSPSVFTAKNGTLPPNLRRPEPLNSYSAHHAGNSINSNNSAFHTTTKTSKYVDDRYNLSKSNALQNLFPNIPPLPKSSSGNNFPQTPSWLDPQYFSALMRFLPTAPHFKDLESSFRSTTTTSNGVTSNNFNESSENRHGKCDRKAVDNAPATFQNQPPPAAHFAVAKYSPTINQATSLLLEVRPLSQDDLDYFQRYQGLMNEAIEYVRGVSQMLMKKVEIIEGHMKESKAYSRSAPLNCANN